MGTPLELIDIWYIIYIYMYTVGLHEWQWPPDLGGRRNLNEMYHAIYEIWMHQNLNTISQFLKMTACQAE